MRRAERGYQLIELLIAMAISSLVLAFGVPPLLALAAGLRVELAAAEVASTSPPDLSSSLPACRRRRPPLRRPSAPAAA